MLERATTTARELGMAALIERAAAEQASTGGA
jgi:hypothetical protein